MRPPPLQGLCSLSRLTGHFIGTSPCTSSLCLSPCRSVMGAAWPGFTPPAPQRGLQPKKWHVTAAATVLTQQKHWGAMLQASTTLKNAAQEATDRADETAEEAKRHVDRAADAVQQNAEPAAQEASDRIQQGAKTVSEQAPKAGQHPCHALNPKPS